MCDSHCDDSVYSRDVTIGIKYIPLEVCNFTATCPHMRTTCSTGRLPAIPKLLGVLYICTIYDTRAGRTIVTANYLSFIKIYVARTYNILQYTRYIHSYINYITGKYTHWRHVCTPICQKRLLLLLWVPTRYVFLPRR